MNSHKKTQQKVDIYRGKVDSCRINYRGEWCLGWCLQIIEVEGIGVSYRLVPKNCCNIRFIPIINDYIK